MNQTETDTSSADSGIHSSSMPSPIYGPLDIVKKQAVFSDGYGDLFKKEVNKNGLISNFIQDLDLSHNSIQDKCNGNFDNGFLLTPEKKPLEKDFYNNLNLSTSKYLNNNSDLESLSEFKFQPTCLSRVSSLEAHELSLSDSPANPKLNYSKSLILLENMKSLYADELQDHNLYDTNDRKKSKSLKDLKKQRPSVVNSSMFNCNNSIAKKKGLKMSLLNLSDDEIQILKTISIEHLQKYNIKTQIPKDVETHRKSFKEIFNWRRSQPDSLNYSENGNQPFCNRIFGVSLPTCIKNEEFFEKFNIKYENKCNTLLTSIYNNAGLIFAPNKRLKCPRFVLACTDYLLKNGLNQVGIFRVNGSRGRIEELKKEINCNGEPQLKLEPNIHDIASILKEFFRELPEPLISKELYFPFISLKDLADMNDKIKVIKCLISLLPRHNRDTLYVLLLLLNTVALCSRQRVGDKEHIGNKMNANNLATIFATNIIRPYKKLTKNADEIDLHNHAGIIHAVSILISHFVLIFQIDDNTYAKLASTRSKDRIMIENCCQTETTINATPICRTRPHSTLPEYSKDFLDNFINEQQLNMNNTSDVTDHYNSLQRQPNKRISSLLDCKINQEFNSSPINHFVNSNSALYKRQLPILPRQAISSPYKLKLNSHKKFSHLPNYSELLLKSSRLSNIKVDTSLSPSKLESNNIPDLNNLTQFREFDKSFIDKQWEQWQKETELNYLLTGECQTLV